ncbi:NAD(P)-dependent oxidoreductase [Bacillus spizizenii]|uniref:NAD dependent epimerase/dehydratase family protein n=2 Tax=Bacillus spizizenii TaxID=96241 RepID=G4NZN9_BACS4|nr:NAD(P)-dependent oxidoreductase [Bacillus spizizenii]MBK4204097.1 NAD(P)-dependent oxidoreductase [Bacillus subtilis]CUB17076.1 NAD dependent epimerase/dehydratase family protein [Bacillus cereus]AEP87868.1 NAD dependent epimerase/dehydratase family protein [Bacillus spizizenii TU-B-10]MCY7863938.1 NAD(P)-dependent oxidoreductase [Bacillus spizizenii]MCY8453947.1 NAD(P)-dependent oxidoreductase [Bacillus spizizenii]
MKKVLIAGGNGVIGRLLAEGLISDYEVTVLDKDHFDGTASSIQADAANYEELLKKIPKDTDVILNLLAVNIKYDVMDIAEFEKMTDVFYRASYYLCRAAAELGIQKLVFASSNHVTDVYEKDGRSLLGREITTSDYPLSKNLYGVLKLTSEQIGHLFYLENKLSVINLRIGTVVTDEMDTLHEKERTKKTLLSHPDLLSIFKAAIETNIRYGTYYAVSDNPGRPWSIESAVNELGFSPQINTAELLKEEENGA